MRAVLWIVLWGFCHLAIATTLEAMAVRGNSQKTSIVFTYTGNLQPVVFMLDSPHRVVVDFNETTKAIDAKRLSPGHGLVAAIRSGYPRPQRLRLVFDVTQAVRMHTTTWSSPLLKQRGLRIDLTPETRVMKTKPAVEKRPTPTIASHPIPIKTAAKTVKAPIAVQHAPSKALRDVIVVLDPGHGGKDPGAIGSGRHAEKQVVLAIALKLKQLIDKQSGMHAVLTRQGDYYIGLRERLNLARRHNADIFISIHADAFINQHSSGASVFALSQRGATSEAARWLAEKENYSELGGVNLSGQSGLVRTVLLDLSQTATIAASLQMGTRVLRHLDNVTNLHNHVVEQARFVVLKSPDIPSVLIETGFITNPREEANLTNPRYQARMTQAIFEGIKRYFFDYPPQGTRVEAWSGGRFHVVKKGEKLEDIAARYHVSVASLKTSNHLTQETLKIGQKITL